MSKPASQLTDSRMDPQHIWFPDSKGGPTRCIRCQRVKNPNNAALPCERAAEALPA